ncbi:MAG: hypothetical protein WDM79_12305 [Terricaulis sp.]
MISSPRYKAGQTVLIGASRMNTAPAGRYTIVMPLPSGGGAMRYRVKGEKEACERVVEERLMELQEF